MCAVMLSSSQRHAMSDRASDVLLAAWQRVCTQQVLSDHLEGWMDGEWRTNGWMDGWIVEGGWMAEDGWVGVCLTE